jgi:hypothetical protein
MDYVQIKDGKVIKWELPCCGFLSNGESVSGYDLLSHETLIAEGWLPTVDNIPKYDETIQRLAIDNYEILDDKVIINYKVINVQ